MTDKILRIKPLIFLFSLLCVNTYSISQEVEDTMKFGNAPLSRISILLDDTYFTGGLNISGLYYSNNFRNLSYAPGFFVGVEHYFPTTAKFFTNVGLNITKKSFTHKYQAENRLTYNNLYLDIPITFSYELPMLRSLDFRMLLGLFGSARLASWTNDEYNTEYLNGNSNFIYDHEDFKSIDVGWLFGASIEFGNYMARVRCFSSWNKLHKVEQGMINNISFDFGYFFFRDKRWKK